MILFYMTFNVEKYLFLAIFFNHCIRDSNILLIDSQVINYQPKFVDNCSQRAIKVAKSVVIASH